MAQSPVQEIGVRAAGEPIVSPESLGGVKRWWRTLGYEVPTSVLFFVVARLRMF